MARGAEIARAARSCLGARFRPHGRNPEYGLDCVGLAGIAFGRSALPDGYALRGGDAGRIGEILAGQGLVPIDAGRAGEGDLLLLRAGPGQFHLAVLTERGFVHADAGLRRVVERPGMPPWPVESAWREEG